MRLLRAFLVLSLLLLPQMANAETLMMATTTSTQDTGLLEYLQPIFKKDTGIDLKWISVGTGKALAHGKDCDVDVLLVHAPALEEKFVADGFGVDRHQVMYNDFVLIGPAADPAGVKGKDIPTALKTFAEKKIPFVSRGDNSGTHNTEKQLWKVAGMEVPGKDATWYIDAGQGMMATIRIAAEKDGYTVTDRGTYIKYNAAAKGDAPLKILVEGDKALLNQYSVMMVNPAKCPKVKQEAAKKFINWWISPNTQKAIASFQLEGKQLFFPNAKAGKEPRLILNGRSISGKGGAPTLSLPSPTPPVRPLSFRQAFILTESLPPHPLKPLSLQRRISWRTGFSALEHFKTELFHFPCIPLLFFLSAEPNSRRAASPPVKSL